MFDLVNFISVPVCVRCCYENMCRKIILSHFPQRIEALNTNSSTSGNCIYEDSVSFHIKNVTFGMQSCQNVELSQLLM